MNVVKIKTSKPYDVVVCDSFVGLNEEIAEITGDGIAFIVYDNNTKKLFSEEISEELCDLPTIPLTVKEGEKCKTFAEYKRLTGLLAKYGRGQNGRFDFGRRRGGFRSRRFRRCDV